MNPQDLQFLKEKAKKKGIPFENGDKQSLFRRLFPGAKAPIKVEEVINYKLDMLDSAITKISLQSEQTQKFLVEMDSKLNITISSIEEIKKK